MDDFGAPDTTLDVACIGNAIVDVLTQVDDDTIRRLALNQGTMTLIDRERAQHLYERMGPAVETSGGSAANTAAGLASLGGRAGFVGKVRNDQLGAIFTHDIRASGVAFDTPPAEDGPPTARCLLFVTPDAQRTMNTYLGACVGLGPQDISPARIRSAAIVYMEGYLWDPPEAKAAFLRAAEIAHAAGRKVSITLSDPFCVERHRASFRRLVREHIDILFANEAEIIALYEAESFDAALQRVRGECAIAALTRSERGSVIVGDGEIHVIDAAPVVQVVDTTGAGDQYAAGFLFGLTHGHDLASSGRIASLAAGEVIDHIGPRPQVSLAALMRERLGL